MVSGGDRAGARQACYEGQGGPPAEGPSGAPQQAAWPAIIAGLSPIILKPPPYWEDCERTVMVANRTRESRPSGMKRGAHGNVMHDLMTICHEAGNSGYLGSHRSKHARAAFLSRLFMLWAVM
jgi:hypothetical protein